MRSAALRSKLPLTEDAITASFADLLRVHSATTLVAEVLRIARVVDADGAPTAQPLGDGSFAAAWDTFALDLWPRWRSGEPDLVLRLFRGTELVGRVVIEVKTGAAKSSEDSPEATSPQPDRLDGDQLAAYLSDAATWLPRVPAALIYLTHHPRAPQAELADSRRAANARQCSAPIAWLGWFAVEDMLARAALARPPASAWATDLADAIAVLRRVPGLYRFHGRWRADDRAGLRELPDRVIWSTRASDPTRCEQRTWRLDGASVRAPGERVFYVALTRDGSG